MRSFADAEEMLHLLSRVPGLGAGYQPRWRDSRVRRTTEVRTNQRDGYGQQVIHPGTSYAPNSVGGGCPATLGGGRLSEGVFEHYQERGDGRAIRRRSPSFADHYSQAALFWRSMADWEREHIIAAFSFELGKVGDQAVRRRMVANLTRVDEELAVEVACRIGEPAPDRSREKGEAETAAGERVSPALSLENLRGTGIRTRKVAVLVAQRGRRPGACRAHRPAGRGCHGGDSGPARRSVGGSDGQDVEVDRALATTASVLYDAVVVPDGTEDALVVNPDAVRFVNEALRHGKPVAVLGTGAALVRAAGAPGAEHIAGVALGGPDRQPGPLYWDDFVRLIEQHRFPQR
ncbi:catalase-related domain-containing protein [Kitasatospora sp. NPDC058063]|uniref:catalase-related domain-containing protein n=1 Tax=unclassified Kitasatospora TaxID=2633591 RepID=UPI0036DA8AD8